AARVEGPSKRIDSALTQYERGGFSRKGCPASCGSSQWLCTLMRHAMSASRGSSGVQVPRSSVPSSHIGARARSTTKIHPRVPVVVSERMTSISSSAGAGSGAMFRVRRPAAAQCQPLLEPRSPHRPDTQAESGPPPENILRGLSEFDAAQVIGLALVQLRQQLLAEIGHRAGAAKDVLHASAVRMGVPVSQRGGKPWIGALHAAQESAIGAARQVASRKQCAGGPGSGGRAELARQHVDRALGELAVGRDLAAEDREERTGMPVELERVVARDARGVSRVIVQEGTHSAIAPYHVLGLYGLGEVAADSGAEIGDFLGVDAHGTRVTRVLDIRGADEREVALVGNGKHDPVIVILEKIGKAMRVEPWHDDVAALDQPDRVAYAYRRGLLRKAAHPGPGRVDHRPRQDPQGS